MADRPSDLTIVFHKTEAGGRWVASTAEGPDSVMEFQSPTVGVWAITHTSVPKQLEGRGIAAALLDRAVEDARRQRAKIDPLCSYVDAAFRRRPELADVRA
jgi:uncharacterized protein